MQFMYSFLVVAAFVTSIIATPVSLPVCIVGAGPAGLTAAKKLEEKGRKVIIFEKQATVGGKCQAVYERHASLNIENRVNQL